MFADVTFFESVPYFSPQVSVTASETIPPSLSVPLPAPAATDPSPVLLVVTSKLLASKPIQNFRYFYTHRQKASAFEPGQANLSPVYGPPPQPSTSLSDLDIFVALRKVNGLALIILF